MFAFENLTGGVLNGLRNQPHIEQAYCAATCSFTTATVCVYDQLQMCGLARMYPTFQCVMQSLNERDRFWINRELAE